MDPALVVSAETCEGPVAPRGTLPGCEGSDSLLSTGAGTEQALGACGRNEHGRAPTYPLLILTLYLALAVCYGLNFPIQILILNC